MQYNVLMGDFIEQTVCVDGDCKSPLDIYPPDIDVKLFEWDNELGIGTIYYYSGAISNTWIMAPWMEECLIAWERG